MRQPFIDYIKALAIILVIVGHVIQKVLYCDNYADTFLFRFIYSFHMPLFMIMSGYVVGLAPEKYLKTKFTDVLHKRFYALMVPFISWTVIGAIRAGSFRYIVNIVLDPQNGLWFLWALFFISLIHKLLENVTKGKPVLMGGAILITFFLLKVVSSIVDGRFAIDQIAIHTINYSMGYALCKYGILGKSMKHNAPAKIFIGVVLFTVMLPLYHWGNEPFDLPLPGAVNKFLYLLFRLSIGIVGSLTIMSFFYTLKSYRLRVLEYIGKRTLGIYTIHFILLSAILTIHRCLDGYSNVILLPFYSFLLLLASLMIIALLERNKFMSYYLLGKRK